MFVLLAALVVAGVGILVFNLTSRGVTSPPSSVGEETPPDTPQQQDRLTGRVLPLGPSIYMEGTHKLVDDAVEIVAILRASDDKLKLAEGFQVEIFGEKKKTVEGEMVLIEVEEIRFK